MASPGFFVGADPGVRPVEASLKPAATAHHFLGDPRLGAPLQDRPSPPHPAQTDLSCLPFSKKPCRTSLLFAEISIGVYINPGLCRKNCLK